MEKLASTEEPTGEQHVKAFLLGAGLEEDSRLRRTIIRLVRALNDGLFETEDGAFQERFQKEHENVQKIMEKLAAHNGDETDLRKTASTNEPGHQVSVQDANDPRLKLVEMVVIMQQLCTSVRIIRYVSTHFTQLVVSGQFEQVMSELEHSSIASEGSVSVEQLRKEIANAIMNKIDSDDEKLNLDALKHYIEEWNEIQRTGADKRKLERRQRGGGDRNAGEAEAKEDEEMNAMIKEKGEKMRADWRSARLELLSQAGIMPAFTCALQLAVNRQSNHSKNSKQQVAAVSDSHSNEFNSQLQSRRIGRVNAIVDFCAGAIDRSELEQKFLDDDIEPNELLALHNCIHEQVCYMLHHIET